MRRHLFDRMRCFSAAQTLLVLLSAVCPKLTAAEPVVVIDVGSRKQLLFDELFLDRSAGVKLRVSTPFQDPEPVLVPDQPWEGTIHAYNTVLRDRGKFVMWYNVTGKGKVDHGDGKEANELFVCYAESTDGVHWQKPNVGLIEHNGSKQNNILAPSDPGARIGGASVFVDDHGPAEERYKLWTKYYPSKEETARGIRRGTYAMVSPDGLRWTMLGPDRGYPLSRGNASDSQNICFWDADVGKYVAFVRKKEQGPPPRDRTCWVGLMTSDDFEHWTMAEDIFRADEQFKVPGGKADWLPPVDLYTPGGMKVPGVPNAYILLPTYYYHWQKDAFPSTIDVGLATSRDRVNWWRPAPEERQPFLRLGSDGSALSGMLFANPWPIVVGNETWIYYAGLGRDHRGGSESYDSGIFRARLRRDGFVSVDAGFRGGEFTTPLIKFAGKRLELSLDGSAGGWLQVEILSADGTPIAGHRLDECDTIRGNSPAKQVTWHGEFDVSKHAGEPVKLRFVMRSMKLFAFQFVGSSCPGNDGNASGSNREKSTGQSEVRSVSAAGSPIERLRREGIRAKSRGEVQKMEAAGFNLVLPWGGQLLEDAAKSTLPNSEMILSPGDFSEEALQELRGWALQSKKHNQIMMHMMYVAGDSSVRFLSGIEGDLRKYVRTGDGARRVWPAHHYRHVVDSNGDAARWAPCPLERRYWMGFIRPQLELVARVLNETGASGGGALELETYCFYSIYPGMASQKKSFCYCDHCFSEFVGARAGDSQSAAVQANQRFDWLTQQGLLPKYEQFLEGRLASLVREMLLEVRKIDPDFVFGFYPYAPFWYYDGLIRGGGSAELPCLVFPGAEYDGGFMADPPFTFFGDASTPASVEHLRRRKLPAMYAGGLWAKAMNSPEAIATAMDRMLRGADGYWVYDRVSDPFWKQAAKINRWSTVNPGPLLRGDVVLDMMPDTISHHAQQPQEGIDVEEDRIVARFEGEGEAISLFGQDAEAEVAYHANWQGRGALPALDNSVFHSTKPSIRFEPSSSGDTPRSPFIDRKIPASQAEKEQKYELSFWVKCRGNEPVRFWVGQANSKQYPAYMYYRNLILQPGGEWRRARIGVRYKDHPPLVLRFWTPPTNATLWLDDVTLQPVQARTIEIPLKPPASVAGWGAVEWKLSPDDARCEAVIVDAVDGHPLRTRLYSGDNLAPFDAIVGFKPVVLRLQVFPSSAQPVALERIQIRFISQAR